MLELDIHIGVTMKMEMTIVFHPYMYPITLQTDTLTLLEDAKMWEAEYGKDLGNGWLMNHPITKLACYQVHLSQEDDVLSEMDLRIKKTYTKLE